MAAHLSHDGIKEVIRKIDELGRKKPKTKQEIGTEWRRLASFMAGKK